MADDWRDSLQSLLGTLPAGEDSPDTAAEEAPKPHKGRLDIIVDRKGRNGKTATIISGFTSDEEEVARVAAELKRRLGTGGSARGGEILIQGNRAADVHKALEVLGFKSRII